MSSTTLNDSSPDTPRSGWWPWHLLIATLALLLLIFAARTVPIKQVQSRIDPVTGSTTWQTVWLFGITSGPNVDVSPLETRLKTSGITWTPSWQFLHNTHRTVCGNATCYECGISPPILQFHPVLQEFAAAATDAELREFVRIMQFGTKGEQNAAVENVGEKVLQAMSVAAPRGS